jgi:hypothetical protein
MDQFYLIGDVARMLDVPRHRITYLFVSRRLEETLRIGNRRMFTPADVNAVADALNVPWDEKKLEESAT